MLTTAASPLPSRTEEVAHTIIGCAITVHRLLGPGFIERIYRDALCLELNGAGVRFEREKPITVKYRDWEIPGQRIDLIIQDEVIVELKSVRRLRDIHRRQLVSYLKAAKLRLGLLINFRTTVLKNGIRRVVV